MDLLDFFDVDFPIGRRPFFFRTLFLLSICFALYFFVVSEKFVSLTSTPQAVILFLFGLAISLFYGSAILKRSQDFDSNGMLPLFSYLAFVSTIVLARFFPDTAALVRSDIASPFLGSVVVIQNLYLSLRSWSYS